jgi:alkylhydroperoxidase family enzyme
MFKLKTVRPEEAAGKVAEAYSVFPEGMPVPEPLVLMSASPELAHLQSGVLRYYMTHSNLDMGLLAMIRYLAASELDYSFCIKLNAGLLKMAGGFSDEDLETLKANPGSAPLEDFQKALLLFVLKVIKTPDEVEEKDIDALREMGWTDQDIFDASFHGAAMIGASKLYRAFRQ